MCIQWYVSNLCYLDILGVMVSVDYQFDRNWNHLGDKPPHMPGGIMFIMLTELRRVILKVGGTIPGAGILGFVKQ